MCMVLFDIWATANWFLADGFVLWCDKNSLSVFNKIEYLFCKQQHTLVKINVLFSIEAMYNSLLYAMILRIFQDPSS